MLLANVSHCPELRVDAVSSPSLSSPSPASQRRRLVIVLPLQPLRRGDTFLVQDWPLYITVLAPFLTEADAATLSERIRSGAEGFSALTVTMGTDTWFGRRHTIPVTLVDDAGSLGLLHLALSEAVRPLAATPDEAAFTGTEFRPHVTMKPHGRVHRGDTFLLSQIALVDMAARADANGRTVLATVDLNN
jgi:hypothetical protein